MDVQELRHAKRMQWQQCSLRCAGSDDAGHDDGRCGGGFVRTVYSEGHITCAYNKLINV